MSSREPLRANNHGYNIEVDPAVTQKVAVGSAGGQELTVFEAAGGYEFPDRNEAHPTEHVIRVVGGNDGRNFRLTVEDPQHQIASITIRLYPKDRRPGDKQNPEPTEYVTWSNGVPTCPPHCIE